MALRDNLDGGVYQNGFGARDNDGSFYNYLINLAGRVADFLYEMNLDISQGSDEHGGFTIFRVCSHNKGLIDKFASIISRDFFCAKDEIRSVA